jgi:hypothetical protein
MSREIPVRVRVPGQTTESSGESRSNTQQNESIELELVSTQALNMMLASQDMIERKAIEDVADMNESGVLARNLQSGSYQIIDDNDLQAILDDNRDLPKVRQPSDITLEPVHPTTAETAGELSLVSTQALRKVLGKSEVENLDGSSEQILANFDPYNSS